MERRVVSERKLERLLRELEQQGATNVMRLAGPADGKVEVRWEESAELALDRARRVHAYRTNLVIGLWTLVLVVVGVGLAILFLRGA